MIVEGLAGRCEAGRVMTPAASVPRGGSHCDRPAAAGFADQSVQIGQLRGATGFGAHLKKRVRTEHVRAGVADRLRPGSGGARGIENEEPAVGPYGQATLV